MNLTSRKLWILISFFGLAVSHFLFSTYFILVMWELSHINGVNKVEIQLLQTTFVSSHIFIGILIAAVGGYFID